MTYPGLAAALVDRLGQEAPSTLELREEPEGYLRASLNEERWEAYPLDEPVLEAELDPSVYDPPFPAFAVLEALDWLQEFARTELGEQWPEGEPWAELDDDEIRFGFGDGLSFDPIPVSSLTRE
jgi:hypothetical protein